MPNAPKYVAVFLVLLAIPAVPWVFFAPTATSDMSDIESAFVRATLVHNIVFVVSFLVAAALAFFRVRYWLIAALLVCGYTTLIATPPFVRMGIRGGFVDNFEAIWRHAMNVGLHDGFYTVWNLIVLPVVPALVTVALIPLWWKSRGSKVDQDHRNPEPF